MATAAEKLQTWKNRAVKLKEENERRISQATTVVEVTVGGGAAGFLRGYKPSWAKVGADKQGKGGIDTEFVLGGLMIAVGFTDWAGDVGDDLMAVGAGMVAYGAGRKGEEWGIKKRTETK